MFMLSEDTAEAIQSREKLVDTASINYLVQIRVFSLELLEI